MSTAQTVGEPAPAADSHNDEDTPRASRFRRILGNRAIESSLTVFGFLILFAGYGIWLGNRFLNVEARLLDIHSDVPILVLGLAVLVTLVAGLFDLSVAGMATLTAFLAIGLTAKNGMPFGLVVVVCLLVGVAGGLINGFLVEGLGVNTFIATLGSGGVFTGISAVYGGGTDVVPQPGGHQLPTWFTEAGSFGSKFPSFIMWILVALAVWRGFQAMARSKPPNMTDRAWQLARGGIVAVILLILIFALDLPKWIKNASWLVAIILILATAMWIILQYTTYGRYLKATGSNREAARLAGVNVKREVVKAFVIGGVLSAFAGILVAANQGSAAPEVANGFLLPAFAAAFLSTVVFSTGLFTVWGSIIGGIFVVWVSQGLIVGGLAPTWTQVVNGVVLVAAVALSTIMRRSNRS
jgi:ribose/xylose/arabinose/galactoside ABC-type transport system permease subunit